MACLHLPGCARLRLCAAALAAVACAAAGGAFAQGVVKCIDVDGNVTYQDSPCPSGRAGRPVDLPKAETREDTSAWEAAARDARVVRGMPKRWVLKSRGAPLEIRPGAPREDATEVWRYAGKEGVLLVGFAGPNVGWVRDEAVPRSGAPAPVMTTAPPPAAMTTAPPPPAMTTAPSPPATSIAPAAPAVASAAATAPPAAAIRGAQNRRFVLEGRYCEHVFAEIGPADREEPLPTGGVRYYYDPREGDPAMRTVFSCVGGKVADVERTMAR